MAAEINERYSYGDGTDNHSDDLYDSAGHESGGGTPESEADTPEPARSEINVRRTRSQEAVRTLLSSFGKTGDRCSDEFLKHDIKFRDLSGLTEDDLTLLGIADPDEQSIMLDTFQELPSQEMHYDRLCKTDEAQGYNNQILGRSQSHLNTMSTSLSAAYLKMRVDPSNDVVVDEKVFASRFVLDAIDELKKATDDMEERLRSLEHIAFKNATARFSTSFEKNFYKSLVVVGGICTGVLIAFWIWRR